MNSPYGPPPSNGSYPGPGLAPGGYPPPYQYGPAVESQTPSIGPVIAFTFFFGIFGAISAARRFKRAQAVGMSGRKYWIAFGITLVAMWVLGAIVVVAVAVGTAASTPAVSSKYLENSIVQNGDFTTTSGRVVEVESATCTAGVVDDDGAGTYTCMIDFADSTRANFQVSVEANGKWVTQPR